MLKIKSKMPGAAKPSASSDSPGERRMTYALEDSEASAEAAVFVADPITSRRAARSAVRAAEKISKNSRIIDQDKEDAIPRFSPTELVLGEILGRGGFSDVYEIFSIDISKEDAGCHKKISKYTVDDENDSSIRYPRLTTSPDKEQSEENEKLLQRVQRSFLAEHCAREETGVARYAIKHLSETSLFDPKQFRTGAADLAVEAKFLCCLEHPNIIKLRGLASSGPQGFAAGMNTGYFLILDRLFGTLEEKLEVWYRQKQKFSSSFLRKNVVDRKGKKRQELFEKRMMSAFDVVGALAYLHSHKIIYRDLKPENIGFDIRGDVKIFDFGLATELNGECKPDDTYNLTGNTGSLRYMAPEVARSEDYNLSADVYSYAVLLWQILSLEKPYDGMDRRAHSNKVVYGLTRPEIDPSWSEPLRNIINDGWHPNLHKRPTIDHIYRVVRLEIARLCGVDAVALDHSKRRSTFVLDDA